MTIVGQRRRRYRRHNFLVEVDGIQRAGFVTCSELKRTIEIIEHREGLDIEPEKLPGLATTENITLTWGASDDFEFWEWFQDVVDSRSQGGLTDDLIIRSMDIVQRQRDQNDAYRWTVDEVWPSEVSLGEFDKNANELTIHSVVLAARGIAGPTVAQAA